MKKRLVMILAMTMCMFLCACGGSESTSGNNKDGFTPSQATEKEETETKDTETIIEIDENNLEQYYDTEKIVGTPRLEKCRLRMFKNKDHINVYTDFRTYKIEPFKNFVDDKDYNVIFTDNNTPDDYSDDVVAYIFTTPVE